MGRSPLLPLLMVAVWLCSTHSCNGHTFSANLTKVSDYGRCEEAGKLEQQLDGVSFDHSFTQYLLSQQWTTTLCREEKFSCDGRKDLKPWTLHGLWPNRSGHKHGPTNCDRHGNFDEDSIKDLLPRLDREWPNLKRNSDSDHYGLWRHEWKEHGTCCPKSLGTEQLYFSKVLDLFENEGLNFEDILQSAGIVPSSNTTYSVEQILSAFGKGVVNTVACSQHKTSNNNGVPFLVEIRICLNKDTFGRCQCKQRGGARFKTCGSGSPKDIQVMYEPPKEYITPKTPRRL